MNLPVAELAAVVGATGPEVVVFPINGTRRWFMLEHSPQGLEHTHQTEADMLAAYLHATEINHIDLYRLFFEHGIDTLLTPVFGPDILERSQDYLDMAAYGLSRLGTAQHFLDFFDEYGVRVRFYGDYRKHLAATPYASLIDGFDALTARTAQHDRHRLFFGLFAHDATETVAELSIQYYNDHGRVPDKRALVELYYGEYVSPADIFIGFDKFSAFDMPLVAVGEEDLYFTVAPSPYLTEQQLREILFDHLYTRRIDDTDYSTMEPDEWNLMREFYQTNMGKTLGVGAQA
ncbi:MAG: diterpene synthase, partial [Chloroflexi bacterium]|nr:diterpene synthase [Chloroflexota bacterium]